MSAPTARRPLARTASGAVALIAALLSLGVSVYLTVEHYNSSATLACPDTGAINCQKVTTSSYAVIAGVPVAVLGLAYFVVMCALLALPSRRRELDLLRVLGAGVGVVMVLYLVYVELLKVDAICLWCTAIHVLTVVMFAALVWARAGESA